MATQYRPGPCFFLRLPYEWIEINSQAKLGQGRKRGQASCEGLYFGRELRILKLADSVACVWGPGTDCPQLCGPLHPTCHLRLSSLQPQPWGRQMLPWNGSNLINLGHETKGGHHIGDLMGPGERGGVPQLLPPSRAPFEGQPCHLHTAHPRADHSLL